MELGWVAIAVGDVVWITLAFTLGFFAKKVGLPPLVGFLVTGFILYTQDEINTDLFQKLADIGITLLLFTVGLKINIKNLLQPQVWAVTGIHMLIITLVFGVGLYGLTLIGLSHFSDLDMSSTLVIAFALSFSSTVFVVKVLEEKGELKSLHGRIAIGILIMQDIAAVVFLALSTNKLPSIWAFSLILLIPFRFILHALLKSVGRGELLILYGFILAMGGAEIFELVAMKGDLGALIFGMLIANHPKAEDMAKSMVGFKDLFLLGFFISIGLSGQITKDLLLMAVIITPLIFAKSLLFFALLISFKLRARTSLLASINLTNFSEFGLIVVAIAVSNQWIDNNWLIIIAIAMSFSFVISAILNAKSNLFFSRNKTYFRGLQGKVRLSHDNVFDIGDAAIMIIGMGTLGQGAYAKMRANYGNKVIGVDIDTTVVKELKKTDIRVIQGDPSDADFWDRIQAQQSIELVMITLPKFTTVLDVLDQLKEMKYHGQIAATTKYREDAERLKQEGIMTVSNIFTEAGIGFAEHVTKNINMKSNALDKNLTFNLDGSKK
jgi:predicted Kef-type K+ transport protein